MLAFIGGSGLYKLKDLKVITREKPQTPFGEPSSPVTVAELNGRRVLFLARHGEDHSYPPHRVPYRANLWALRQLGAKKIITFNAVGGIDRFLKPGDFATVGQFIDFTKTRVQTFFEGRFSPDYSPERGERYELLLAKKKVVHVDVGEPFCPVLEEVVSKTLSELGIDHHRRVTYAATEGPRLESAAEIRALRLLGAEVVGMTLVPEVVLARELEVHFASVAIVTNPAAGVAGYRLTAAEVIEMMRKKEKEIEKLVLKLIDAVYERTEWNCECERTLEGAEV